MQHRGGTSETSCYSKEGATEGCYDSIYMELWKAQITAGHVCGFLVGLHRKPQGNIWGSRSVTYVDCSVDYAPNRTFKMCAFYCM